MKKLHKNLHKLLFYVRAYFLSNKYGHLIFGCKKKIPPETEDYLNCPEVRGRVEYYNNLSHGFSVSDKAMESISFSRKDQISSYYFDLKMLLRSFPEEMKFDYIFGDVVTVPNTPSFVKSRPINDFNNNAILLKLDSVRHYYVYPDKLKYKDKMDLIVWRGAAHQPHRKEFVKNFYNHPLCNIGCVHKKSKDEVWHKSFMSVAEQLKYKFILSIEGNDVATNLKWIMASNSLCFMVKPKFETWFMEGLLVPGYHYVELKNDYSDLEEKVNYYIHNPDEAEVIIKNANEHFSQFMDAKKEKIVSLLVMKKYFEQSGQIKKEIF